MIRTILAAGLLLAVPSGAHATNLLVNGGFEAGGGSLAGWAVSGTMGVATGAIYGPCCGANGSEPAFSGNHFAVFGGGNVASANQLGQGFATIIGKRYDVSLRYGTLGGGGAQSIIFNISGGLGFAVLSAAANNSLDTTFTTFTTSFIANDMSTSIGFGNISGVDGIDPILDDVSVTTVPEPSSWAMLIAGFGLVGAVARRQRHAVTA
jgi:PEP-CTERM motif